jgi:hypothetical protein
MDSNEAKKMSIIADLEASDVFGKLQRDVIEAQQRDSLEEGNAEAGCRNDARQVKETRVKGVIQWFRLPKAEIEHLCFPKIVPGENDMKVERVMSTNADKATQMIRSRGHRGAKIIAAAAQHMLEDIATGRVRILEGVDTFSSVNFESPILLTSELEFFQARSTEEGVLAMAQAILHAASEWTPLIEVPSLDPKLKDDVIEASLKRCDEANTLCYSLVQRKGDNVKGDIVCYEDHKKQLDWLRPRRERKRKWERPGEEDFTDNKKELPHSGSREALFYDPARAKKKEDAAATEAKVRAFVEIKGTMTTVVKAERQKESRRKVKLDSAAGEDQHVRASLPCYKHENEGVNDADGSKVNDGNFAIAQSS